MIYGNINAKETEAAYTPVIRKALDILRTTDVSEMHHGKYPIDGDKLILQINEITTGPKETKRPEVHRQYIRNISGAADIAGAIWGCMGYTVLLCFCLFKTGSISKSVFGAH